MTEQQIQELVSIRTDEINQQIQDIKNFYDIEVNNALLMQLVTFSFNAIDYYNEKYNCFDGNEYEQLFAFINKFYNAIKYKYNLLHSKNYTNKEYNQFLNLFPKQQQLNLLDNIFIIIQEQIEILNKRNIYISQKTSNINYSMFKLENITNINLSENETILYLIYYYLAKDNDLEIIKNNIQENLQLLKFGKCNLFENIYLNYTKCCEITNMNTKLYLDILEQNDADYNLILHQNVLNYIKGMN